MELVCGSSSNNNLPSDDHSNDSSGDINDAKYMGLGGDGKGSLRYVYNTLLLNHFLFF